MFQRIGFFLIGMAAIFQAQSLFLDKSTFREILLHFILYPVQFFVVAMFFLLGIVLFSHFFSHFVSYFYDVFRKREKCQMGKMGELVIFVFLFFYLFHQGFWFPLVACILSCFYGMGSVYFGQGDSIFPDEED